MSDLNQPEASDNAALAVSAARAAGDDWTLANAIASQAWQVGEGDPEQGRLLNEALAAAHRAGDSVLEAVHVLNLAIHLEAIGRYDEAIELHRQAYAVAVKLDLRTYFVAALLKQASIAMKRGDMEHAEELHRQAGEVERSTP